MGDVRHIWKFNQGDYNRILKQSEFSRSGICEGLVYSWIVTHGTSGGKRHLKDELSTKGKIDSGQFDIATKKFIAMYVKTDSASPKPRIMTEQEQKSQTTDRMSIKGFRSLGGLMPINKKTSLLPGIRQGVKSAFSGMDEGIKSQLDDTIYFNIERPKKNETIYCFIRVDVDTKAGHCMGMMLPPQKGQMNGAGFFFDPNQGEFFFRVRKDFEKWFEDFMAGHRYWRYATYLGLSFWGK